MKKIILCFAVLVAANGMVTAQSVDEIVAKNINAMGGAARLHEVKTVVIESSISVQGLVIENVTTILAGKAMRSDSKIMGNDMVQAYDGTTSWAITPVMMGGSGEPGIMGEEMAKSIINQADPFPLLDYVEKGTNVQLLGSEKVQDKEAYHIKISPKKGTESEVWIDAASGLVLQLKTIQNGQEVEVSFSDYIVIEGLSFAMHMKTSNPMAGVISIDTKKVQLNVPIEETIFTMPTAKN